MKNKEIVAISIFSGCGGLDLASISAGVPVVSSLDFDSDSIKTLKLNKEFKNSEIIETDIAFFDSNHYIKLVKQLKPKKFIVIGGPPCQPFSKAGYWIGNKSRKIENDPRNMVDQYLRILSELKPDGFIFENVESLKHPTNKKVIEKIENHIKSLKYNYKIVHANALDYGVPQKRKRLFIIGTKGKFKSEFPKKTHGEGLIPYEGVGKFISKYEDKKYFEKEEVANNGTYYAELKKVPPGKNYIALCGSKNTPFKKGGRFWNFLLKLHPDEPSWTIAAQPGPWVGPFHWNSRRLRIPEIAAIQTFPENYKFYGSRRSVQKQIGNAVPPLMGKAMIEHLRDSLL